MMLISSTSQLRNRGLIKRRKRPRSVSLRSVIEKKVRGASGPYLLLLALSLVTLFFRLGDLPFIGADECRYARIAEEMNLSGRWVTPVLQGFPWLEKPPLYYWITIPSYKLFGVSEASARLGPALCALLTCAAVLWLGSKLWSLRAGFISSLIMLSSIGFCAYGRSASTDMPITACFTIAFALLAAAVLKGGLAWWQVGSAYVFLGLAVLAKGPVAVVLAAGIIILFWTLDEEKGSLRKAHVVSGAIVAAAVSLPWFWFVFRQNGFSFISIFFINHNLARYVSDIHHHEQPLYYFVPILLGFFFPWSGWLPVLVPPSWRRKAIDRSTWDRRTVFLACWLLVPLLFFSLSTSKLPGYVLPSMPPLALLLGQGFASALENKCVAKRLRAARWAHLLVSICVAAAFPFVLRREYADSWSHGIMLGMAALLPALAAFHFARRGRMLATVHTTVAQGAILLLAVTQFGFPLLAETESTRDIARQALAADTDAEPIVTYFFFHQTVLYYTGYRIDANIVDPQVLVDYARQKLRFLAIMEAPQVDNLQRVPELDIRPLGAQGKLRLVRISLRRPTSDLRLPTSMTQKSEVGSLMSNS